jgi:hypothetical protein
VFRLFRTLPWFRVLAISKLALTARRHLRNLTPAERRRLVSKLDARAFGATAVGAFAPWPIGRMARGRGR